MGVVSSNNERGPLLERGNKSEPPLAFLLFGAKACAENPIVNANLFN
jgi:hypothetical protein